MRKFNDVCLGDPPSCDGCGGTEFELVRTGKAKVAGGGAGFVGVGLLVVSGPVGAALAAAGAAGGVALAPKRVECQTCGALYKRG